MPTELETMKHAKEYIDKLANGIGPFSDKPVPDGDIINNVKLSRCFFYISGILEKVIENGGEVAKPQVAEAVRPHKRGSVVITDEARAKFRCFINEVSLSTFTDMINKHIDSDVSVKLKGCAIADWLTVIGMLTEETLPNGKLKRVPTENGISEGIRLNEYFTPGGFPGYAIMLSPAAQQFVLDNIDAIAEMNGLPREKRNRLPFEVTDEMRQKLTSTEKFVTATDITQNINSYVDEEKSGTLKTGSVSKWLEEQGVLENTELPSGRKTRLPTEQGVKLGIETRQRTSQRGEEYTAVVYSKQARQFKRSQGMTPLEFRRKDGDGVGTVE
ncbi:MAG: hypothetical protein BHW21_05425 [Eubacterium sp. 45_250]|nr:MAG: hypothetical protein BHW21_05425 [Eubacterium sp. 45_250]